MALFTWEIIVTEKPANGVKGYILYNIFDHEYFFRVYDHGKHTDYRLAAEDIKVEIISGDHLSLYERESEDEDVENKLDWSSAYLGKSKVPSAYIKQEAIMNDQRQLFDNLFAKIKEIASQFETTAASKIEQVLEVADQLTIKVSDQLNHLHETMDAFLKKAQEVEQRGEVMADELVAAMNQELAQLQKVMEDLIAKLKK